MQPKAGRLIGLVLDKMVPQDFDYSVGIKSELSQFLDRCVSDIEKSPESMQAGLSSVLLQEICLSTAKMQVAVAKQVFLRMIAEMAQQIPLNRRVAYLTVLTGLLSKAQ